MLKGNEVAIARLRSRVTKALEQLRSLDCPRLALFDANKREPAYCTHLVLAALLFSPFLLFGHVVAGGTDRLLESYPLLLLGKRDFLQGSLGLWNPYSFAGIPQTADANATLLVPENWILYLLPSRYLFSAITLFDFIKVWLVGVAAYRFYCAELLNRRWALFASIACQLCGMTIWLLGTYVGGLSLVLFYIVLLTLIWTAARRSSLANYLLWSAVTTLMLIEGDLVYACYALLGAGILVLYRAASRYRVEPAIVRLALFAASSLTALAIFCIRLLPTLDLMQTSSAVGGCCSPQFADFSFLIARYFDTEMLGVNFKESMEFFQNMSPLFKTYHLHTTAPQYFGIAAALLALWMLTAEKSAKAAFWSVYVAVGLGILMFVQPFDAFAQILLSPIMHMLSIQGMFMLGLPALAALGGMSLERAARRGRFSRLTIEFFIFALVVIAMLLLVIAIRNIAPLAAVGSGSARIVVVGSVLLAAAVWWVNSSYPVVVRAAALPILAGIAVIALVIVLFWTSASSTFLSHLKNIGLQLLLFSAIAVVLLLILRDRTDLVRRYGTWAAVPRCRLLVRYALSVDSAVAGICAAWRGSRSRRLRCGSLRAGGGDLFPGLASGASKTAACPWPLYRLYCAPRRRTGAGRQNPRPHCD